MANPDVADIDNALQRADVEIGASESHGLLCGMLCVRAGTTSDQWLDQVLHGTKPQDVLVNEARILLRPLYDETVRGLNDAACDFQLLLRDDAASLELRTEALVGWCRGFLFGLAAGGVKDLSGLPEDVVEFTRDLAEITRASHRRGAGGEEDEVAYAEIVEYIRMGILLCNEELNPTNAPPQLH